MLNVNGNQLYLKNIDSFSTLHIRLKSQMYSRRIILERSGMRRYFHSLFRIGERGLVDITHTMRVTERTKKHIK